MASLGNREQKVRTASQFACLAICLPIANNSSSSNDTLVSGVVDATLCSPAHLPLCCYYIHVLTWKRGSYLEDFQHAITPCSPATLSDFCVCDTPLCPHSNLTAERGNHCHICTQHLGPGFSFFFVTGMLKIKHGSMVMHQ